MGIDTETRRDERPARTRPRTRALLPVGLVCTLAVMAACSRDSHPEADRTRTLIEYHLQYRQFAPARDLLAGMVENGSATASEYSQLSELYLAEGNTERGEQVIKDGLTRFPDDATLLVRHGSYAAALTRYDEAVTILSQARALDAANPMVLRTLSLAQTRQGQLVAAADTARELYDLVRGPDEGVFYASQLQAAGKVDEAVRVYREVLTAAPDDLLALNNLAALLSESEDPADAEALARRARDQAPENGRVLDTLGWVLYRKGERQEAAELLDRAARLAPGAATVRYHQGVVLNALGRQGEAREALTEALRLDADAEWAANAQALLGSRARP